MKQKANVTNRILTEQELPMTIAPDGRVIQLKLVPHEEDNGCDTCVMSRECSDIHNLKELLGVRCMDYDEMDYDAIWEEVKDER